MTIWGYVAPVVLQMAHQTTGTPFTPDRIRISKVLHSDRLVLADD